MVLNNEDPIHIRQFRIPFEHRQTIYDWSTLSKLLLGEKVRMQCEKTGSWERIGEIVEMRPDQLSYLVEVEGKLYVRAGHILRPAEKGGVFDQVQVQGGAQAVADLNQVPRRSERLKERNLINSIKSSKCVEVTTMMPNSGSTVVLTGCRRDAN